MSQAEDVRAQRKAQTRRHIRDVAQRLFAERGFDAVTVSDVAGAAAVSAQTVFNHFTSKEELFFDGRSAWVSGPADAVRFRRPDVPPLNALREHLVATAVEAVRAQSVCADRELSAAIAASPSLSAHQRGLLHQAELQLSDALAEAFDAIGEDQDTAPPTHHAASVIAATWLAGVRALVVARRSAPRDAERTSNNVAWLVKRLLEGLQDGLRPALGLPYELGRPAHQRHLITGGPTSVTPVPQERPEKELARITYPGNPRPRQAAVLTGRPRVKPAAVRLDGTNPNGKQQPAGLVVLE